MPKATLVDAVVDDGKTPAVEAKARKVKKPKNATSARRGRNKLKATAASAAVAATSTAFSPPPPPGMLAASAASPSIDANSVFVAVGLLSTAKGNTKAKNATISLGRRQSLRSLLSHEHPELAGRMALRFLIARNGKSLNASNPIFRESEAERDILFLNMTEAKHRCSLKYFLWFRLALPLFPSARFFVLGDDDVYVQLAHLEADLRLVHSQTAGQHVLWGLIMWKVRRRSNACMAAEACRRARWPFFCDASPAVRAPAGLLQQPEHGDVDRLHRLGLLRLGRRLATQGDGALSVGDGALAGGQRDGQQDERAGVLHHPAGPPACGERRPHGLDPALPLHQRASLWRLARAGPHGVQ